MITSVGKQTPRLLEIDFLKAVLIILIRSIQELKQEAKVASFNKNLIYQFRYE